MSEWILQNFWTVTFLIGGCFLVANGIGLRDGMATLSKSGVKITDRMRGPFAVTRWLMVPGFIASLLAGRNLYYKDPSFWTYELYLAVPVAILGFLFGKRLAKTIVQMRYD